jgi:hypothetical protein
MRQNFQGQYSPKPPTLYAAPAIPQDVPCYRILAGKGVFLDDFMFFEGDIVTWPDEPNKEMEPLNDLAREATTAFFDERERLAQIASAAKGTRYIPLRRPIEEEREMNSADARRVELIKGDGGVPVMGARKKGRPKVEKVDMGGIAQKPIADLARAGKNAANSVMDS